MECIFNELSAQPVGTVPEAYDMMSHFIQAVSAARQMGIRQVRIHEELGQNLFSLLLAPDCTIGTWLNDERVNGDLRNQFRLITANPPLLTVNEVDAMRLFERSLFCLTAPAGVPEAKGFGAAYLSSNLLLSLLSSTKWNTHQLTGWHWYLDINGQEQVEEVTVFHLATTAHLELHKSAIQQRQSEQLKRSIDVWAKREDFFPHLILCGDVKRQLKTAGMSSYLSQIIDRLRTLDSFVSKWQGSNFNTDQLNAQTNLRVSGESDSTLYGAPHI